MHAAQLQKHIVKEQRKGFITAKRVRRSEQYLAHLMSFFVFKVKLAVERFEPVRRFEVRVRTC